jgi:hypothetical protein
MIRGALPRTPFKKLFEKSFLKIFKNFDEPKLRFGGKWHIDPLKRRMGQTLLS